MGQWPSGLAGARPIAQGEMPLSIRGLVQPVKACEALTAQDGVQRDHRKVTQGLMAHPVVPRSGSAKPLLDDVAEANRAWLPWLP
ncbi:MAG: hypothetical protein ACC726_09500 [Chloroflexota bacterium]